MKSIDRLFLFLEYKGVKPTNFEQLAGFSKGYFSGQRKRNGDFGETILRKIINLCPEMSEVWFLTGEGPMLKNQYNQGEELTIAEEPSLFIEKKNDLKEQIVKLQKECLDKSNRIIELMDLVAELKEELQNLKSAGGAENRTA